MLVEDFFGEQDCKEGFLDTILNYCYSYNYKSLEMIGLFNFKDENHFVFSNLI